MPQFSDEEPVAGQEQSFWDAMVAFFSQLWSPQTQANEQVGWAYVYDENGTLLAEEGMGGATEGAGTMYIWLPSPSGPIPIAAVVNGEKFAVHADHLNTPRRLTNALGQAAWQWRFSAFGDEVPTVAAHRFVDPEATPGLGNGAVADVKFNLRYPGQYADGESGLHYNYFRSYDGSTGRYTQADPIGLDGGWNRYAYAEANPLLQIDPLGLYTEVIVWGPSPGLNGRWGHMSGNINGQNFSFGPHGWDERFGTAEAYARRQRDPDLDRGGRGIVLDLKPEEERRLAQCLRSAGAYHEFTNNCGNPWLQCLEGMGLVDSSDRARVLPTDVIKIIGSSPRAMGNTNYPGRFGPGTRRQ